MSTQTAVDKLKAYRDSLTQEQKEALLASARAAVIAKAKRRAENADNVKLQYLDNTHWQHLASKYKVRMPNEADPTTLTVLRKYLKKLNVPVETFNNHYTSMSYFVKHNPQWSAYAAAGIILELKEETDSE